jgi:hypothetical protein
MTTTIPIDIPLPDALTRRLTPPTCDDIKLPEPAPPGTVNLCLPFGGSFKGIVDARRGIPDDCALSLSILLQLPPMFASLGCFIKLLKVMKPLGDFIGGAPDVAKMASAAIDLAPIIADVVACFAQIVAGVPMFVKDLLLLIARLLKCLAESIKSLAELMNNLGISIQSAEASGNKALQQQLKCAQDNANAQAQAALGQVDVIALVISLAEPLMSLMPGAPKIAIPSLGSAQSAFEIEQAANIMISVASSLEQIAKALPSC